MLEQRNEFQMEEWDFTRWERCSADQVQNTNAVTTRPLYPPPPPIFFARSPQTSYFTYNVNVSIAFSWNTCIIRLDYSGLNHYATATSMQYNQYNRHSDSMHSCKPIQLKNSFGKILFLNTNELYRSTTPDEQAWSILLVRYVMQSQLETRKVT